jgi:predicted acetyltransferase
MMRFMVSPSQRCEFLARQYLYNSLVRPWNIGGSLSLTITHASRDHESIFQNLIQLYTHDFSQFWSGSPKGDLQADGRFEAYPLHAYWTRPDWSAFLIRHGEALAGFALINDQTHSGQPAKHNVGEFFVVRKYRGQGFGALAARNVFSRYPGSWEVAVARANVGAHEFWRKTIEGAPAARHVQKLDLADERWNGPVFRFEWRKE